MKHEFSKALNQAIEWAPTVYILHFFNALLSEDEDKFSAVLKHMESVSIYTPVREVDFVGLGDFYNLQIRC